MSGISNMRRYMVGAALAACAFGSSYVWSQSATAPVSAPAAASQPANLPYAEVNGNALDNAQFNRVLMGVAGFRVFQEVLNLTLVTEAAGKAGISVTPTELQQMMQDELDRMIDSMPGATKAEKNKVFFEAWNRSGRTEVELQLYLQQQAFLRRMSKVASLEGSTKDIHEAYLAKYGERATIHLMNLGTDEAKARETAASLVTAVGLKNANQRMDKVDVKDLDKAIGEANIQSSGVIISKNAEQVAKIRDEIFNKTPPLAERTISPLVEFNKQYFLIYVDSREKSQMDTVKETDPKIQEELKKAVFDLNQNSWMANRLTDLQRSANVKVNDPILSEIYARMASAAQPASQPSTTQPGMAPTSPIPPAPASTLPALPPLPKPATSPK